MKKMLYSYVICKYFLCPATIGGNGPTLGAVGDFGKLNCQPARIYNRSTNFQLTMLAPIAPNVC